jgi:hypothetical protein
MVFAELITSGSTKFTLEDLKILIKYGTNSVTKVGLGGKWLSFSQSLKKSIIASSFLLGEWCERKKDFAELYFFIKSNIKI